MTRLPCGVSRGHPPACLKTHPVYRFNPHDRAHVWYKYAHTVAPLLLGGCFLFTPFPPLFTRGFSRHLVPPNFHPSFCSGIEHRLGLGTQGRVKRSRHPCSARFSLRGRPIGLGGQSRWQVKFSPRFDPILFKLPSTRSPLARERSRGDKTVSIAARDALVLLSTAYALTPARYIIPIKLYEFVIYVDDARG